MGTFLILLAIVAFMAAHYYIPRALTGAAAKVMYKNTSARDLNEVYTVTSFTSPFAPAAFRRAIDTHLARPHDVPPFLGNLHVSEIRDDQLRIAPGNRLHTEWTRVATFGPAPLDVSDTGQSVDGARPCRVAADVGTVRARGVRWRPWMPRGMAESGHRPRVVLKSRHPANAPPLPRCMSDPCSTPC